MNKDLVVVLFSYLMYSEGLYRKEIVINKDFWYVVCLYVLFFKFETLCQIYLNTRNFLVTSL